MSSGSLMRTLSNVTRRQLLKRLMLGAALVPLAHGPIPRAFGADAPLVTGDDATAKALKYTPDASKAADAKPGSKCANCALYQGAAGSSQGGCLLFPGKSVMASGWCMSWAAKTT